MVGSARGRVNQTAGDARNKQVVVNDKLNNRVQRFLSLFKHVIQLFGLNDSAGETVKDKAVKIEFAKILAKRSK